MTISGFEKYADLVGIIDVLTDDSKKRLGDACVESVKPFWTLTFNEFFACIRLDFSAIGICTPEDLANASVAQTLWVERFRGFIDEFVKVCEALKVPQTPAEKMASTGCKPCTFEEHALLFCREYFGLHSFREAGETTLGDYIIAIKDTYNKAVQVRNRAAQMRKAKK